MDHKTTPTGRPSDYYIIGLVLAGAVFWSLTYFDGSPVALYQLIAFAMFAAAVYLLIRYRLTVFRLKIEGRNGDVADLALAIPSELDFTVERMLGSKVTPLARLSLAELRSVDLVPYVRLKELGAGKSLYRYQADLDPDEGALLVFETDGKEIAIFTDLPPEMFNFLKKCADHNAA